MKAAVAASNASTTSSGAPAQSAAASKGPKGFKGSASDLISILRVPMYSLRHIQYQIVAMGKCRKDGSIVSESLTMTAKQWNESKVSVLEDQVWLLSQNDTEILYKTYSKQQDQKDHFQNENRLRDYFQLDLCKLNDLYPKWRKVDQYFDSCFDKMTGVRTLRQHPVENLFSFICSSNNNIARISSM